jgi:hypothetical protein
MTVEVGYVGPVCYELRFLHNQFYLYEDGRYTGKGFVSPGEAVRWIKRMREEVMRVPNKLPVLKLIGEDGNAFAVLGKARRVALDHKMDWEKIREEAMGGDYDHLLGTMMKYFDVR